jgi:hypothetical protein
MWRIQMVIVFILGTGLPLHDSITNGTSCVSVMEAQNFPAKRSECWGAKEMMVSSVLFTPPNPRRLFSAYYSTGFLCLLGFALVGVPAGNLREGWKELRVFTLLSPLTGIFYLVPKIYRFCHGRSYLFRVYDNSFTYCFVPKDVW